MKKRKALFHADGVLVVDKPAGPTSHDVVDRLRRRFKPAKLGHTGTLDPYATGVLVLAFNQATRLANLFGEGRKIYLATLKLGAATDTADLTGQVIEEAPVPPLSREALQEALDKLLGPRMQAPPAYSAAKLNGRPLYDYARKGVKVEKPPRPITVYATGLVDFSDDTVVFTAEVSKGTYLRSLGEDLARLLDTVGHLSALRRQAALPFSLEQAVDLDEVAGGTPEELVAKMLPADRALAMAGLPAASLDDDRVWELRQGRILPAPVLLGRAPSPELMQGAFRVLAGDGELIAVLKWLEPAERRPGREYETIRVFPERPREQTHITATGA